LFGRGEVLVRGRVGLVSGVWVSLVFVAVFGVVLNVPVVRGSGTIYIRADGSIDPPTANITSADNVTYTFNDNIYDEFVVEKSDIIIDGKGHVLQGSGLGKGFSICNVSNVTIRNSSIEGFTYGLYYNSTSFNVFSGNNVFNNGVGVWLESSFDNVLSNNNITSNGASGFGDGIWLASSSNNTIQENNIIGNQYAGVWCDSSSNNDLCGNNITNNKYGIYVYESSYTNIFDNYIASHYWDGVKLVCSSYDTICGNNITNSGWGDLNGGGIWLYLSPFNNISSNMVTDNYCGIVFEGPFPSSNNTICENDILNNGYGITVSGSCNAISENNILNNGDYGIYIVGSNNTISRNNLLNNAVGIRLEYSLNNLFYHNNLINNTSVQASVSLGYVAMWDDGYPSGGNYWSDYSGLDLFVGVYQNETGSDGIGDTPYVIDTNNQDHYPLMKPWIPGFPIAYFSYSPKFPPVDESVTFNASASYDYEGSILNYTWNFGDDNLTTVTTPITTHIYTAEGIYIVNLTVTDNDGLSRSITKSVTVIPEFPSAIILPLFIALTILTTILTKTNINRQRRNRQQGY